MTSAVSLNRWYGETEACSTTSSSRPARPSGAEGLAWLLLGACFFLPSLLDACFLQQLLIAARDFFMMAFRAIFRARQPTRKKRTSRQSREVQTEVRPVGDSRDEAPPHS